MRQAAISATQQPQQTDLQREIVGMVRRFVDERVIPVAGRYDAADEYPAEIVEQMKELGLLGIIIPERYGGMELDFTTYAMIIEELARGWISIAGVVNTHLIGAYLLERFGTEEQRQQFLPRMSTGELRGAFSLSEPDVGSDVQGLKARATAIGNGQWRLDGQKMWVTGSLRSGIIFVLVKTDPDADPRIRGSAASSPRRSREWRSTPAASRA